MITHTNPTWTNVTLSLLTSKGMSTIHTWPGNPGETVFVIDSSGNYIVSENVSHSYAGSVLSKITPEGARTVIYKFAPGIQAAAEAIDSEGNYIAAEYVGNYNGGHNVSEYAGRLSKITPDGVRTVIANVTAPNGLAIDQFGNYLVTQTIWPWMNLLSKVYPNGTLKVIYNFTQGSWPDWVAVDSSGNYVVNLFDGHEICLVTPDGVERTVATEVAGPYDTVIDSDGNYIVSVCNDNDLIRISPAGVRTVLYNFSTYVVPGEIQVISAGDLKGAPTTTTITPTSTMTTKPQTGTTTTYTESAATGRSVDYTLYAVAGVVAVAFILAAAAFVLRRRH